MSQIETVESKLLTGPAVQTIRSAEEEEEKKDNDKEKGDMVTKKLLETRTVLVMAGIDDKLQRQVTSQLLVLEAIDPDGLVTVFINSPGGSIDAGFGIYDMLKFISCPVRTIGAGVVASAAVLVYLGGDKGNRVAFPNSRFLIHQPSTGAFGQASDIEITANQIKKLRVQADELIASEIDMDVKKLAEDRKRDFWLDATEAAKYKLVDKVVSSRDDLKDEKKKK
ncbi:MAG TPA: ATP-dependent Clp protease proteolytic subunit [Planctomycetota bacterium]|jgi:ATP-dependent Clp protease protease subunit|nr:ATP-dependent Clp protease proteolytic subunit [Planctomycetota bacterium]